MTEGIGTPPPETNEPSSTVANQAVKKVGTATGRTLGEPRETPTPHFQQLIILTGIARGETIAEIARKNRLNQAVVEEQLSSFLRKNNIRRGPNETTQSFPIRTVFSAISNDYVFQETVLEDVNQDFLERLPPVAENYFTVLDTGAMIDDPTAFNEMERQTIEYIETQTELGVKNITHAAAIWKIGQQEEISQDQPLNRQEVKFLALLAVGGKIKNIARHLRLTDADTFITTINDKLGTKSPLEAMLYTINEGLINPQTILDGVPNGAITQLDDAEIRLLENIIANSEKANISVLLAKSVGTTKKDMDAQVKQINTKLDSSSAEQSIAIFVAEKMQREIFQQLLTGTNISQSLQELHDYCAIHDITRFERERDDTLLIRTVFHALDNSDIDQDQTIAGVNLDAMKLLPVQARVYFTQLKNDTEIRDTIWFNEIAEQTEKYVIEHAEELGVTNVVHAAAAWRTFNRRGEMNEVSRELTDAQLNALKLKARGYTDPEIASELSPNDPTLRTDAAVRTRLTRTYEKLGTTSSIIAIKRAMDANIITPEFVLEGYNNLDKFGELSSMITHVALLETLNTDDGQSKSYKQLVQADSPFTSVTHINHLVADIKRLLETRDIYHAAVVYEAAKRLRLI